MICVRCGKDSNYPERGGRKCPGCGKQFAFEPRDGDPFSDKAFRNAIDRVSSEGRIRFGVEHVRYELARSQYQAARARRITAGAIGFWYIDNPGHAGGALTGIVLAAILVDQAMTWGEEISLPVLDFLGAVAVVALIGGSSATCYALLS